MEETVEARIGRYLAGEMGLHEKAIFEKELASDAALKESFHVFQLIWQKSVIEGKDEWNASSGWEQLAQNLNKAQKLPRVSRQFSLYWAVAASVLVLSGAAYFLFLKPSPETYFFADTTSDPVELADGSKVYLNAGSAVTVFPFNRKSRQVKLSGEAFFEISPDQARPFTIETGNTRTEVVGTAFNLKQNGDLVELFVSSGKVIFSAPKDHGQALALTAGESAFFANHKLEMIPNPSPNTHSWHTRQLLFNGTPLDEAVRDISTYFGQVIVIDNEDLKTCMIYNTLPFKNPEIGSVLKSILRTCNADYVEKDGVYIIR